MSLPLHGARILVTRPAGQAEEFAKKLATLGAEPILLPAIEIKPLENTFELDKALIHLDDFDWIVLTSVNGVQAVAGRMAALGVSCDKLAAGGSRSLARRPDGLWKRFAGSQMLCQRSSWGRPFMLLSAT